MLFLEKMMKMMTMMEDKISLKVKNTFGFNISKK